MNPLFQKDVEAIQQIPQVQSILNIIRKTTGMGFAAVARVTEDHWVACAVDDGISFGLLPGGELELKTTLCHEVKNQNRAIIIDNVATDQQYADHHTPKQYGLQSYIAVPIQVKNGGFFGTLCAIDPEPNNLSVQHIREMFDLFAELIGHNLDSVWESQQLTEALAAEKSSGILREQFIAMMGHDLRNPLAVSLSGASMLAQKETDAAYKKVANLIVSSSKRMEGLLDNMMDLTEAQLGEGIRIQRSPSPALQEMLIQIVAEQQLLHPARTILSSIIVDRTLYIDAGRVSQLFSNLVGNAMSHGKPNEPIVIQVFCEEDDLIISVRNGASPITDEKLQRLFKPYIRGESPQSKGLGLGLFIAASIAKAHDGQMEAAYENGEIEFKALIKG